MARTLSTNVAAEAAKDQNRPVELYQVYLDPATLFFAAHPENVPYYDESGQPVTYYSLGLSRSSVKTNMDTKVDEVTVQLDNVTREMSAYLAHTEFVGRRLKIIKVFRQSLPDGLMLPWQPAPIIDAKYYGGPADHVVIFDGIMDAPVITETAMQVTVVSKLDMLGFRVPRRRYQRPCNWKFGSAECGISLASVTVSGTVQAISPDGLTLTLSGRTEPQDYFKDGVLIINSEWQRVVSSNGATIVVDYSFINAQVGDAYSMRRGCDKTFETCRDRFSNQSNFGGFLSVPAERIVRR